MVTFKEIEEYYLKVRSNIRKKRSVNNFELLYYVNIHNLVNNINNGYIYSKYNIFFIKEKKYRLILSNNINDKVYNHLVSDNILSKLDKYLIDSNVASRKNKGTKYGRKLLDRYLVKMKNKYDVFYILKFDIKKYFFNIDHHILLNKLSKYLNNNELNIIKNILSLTNESYINEYINLINNRYHLDLPYYNKDTGLSIGNLVDQMLGSVFLNDFDHYIKEVLGCKYYIRYVDDGIILLNDKDKLKDIYHKLKILIKDYKLEFNNKTKIYCSDEGFEFLGIRYIIKNNKIYRRISNRTKKKIIKRINKINYKFYKHYFKYLK